MKLRTRLFAASALVAVPLALILFFLDDRLRLARMSETLRAFVESQRTAAGVSQCERDPVHFGRRGPPPRPDLAGRGRGGPPPPGAPDFPGGRRGGPPPGPGLDVRGARFEVFAYSSAFAPADPMAPPVSGDLRSEVERGAVGTGTYAAPDGRGAVIAAPFGDPDSACAVVLARLPPRPGEVRDQIAALILVIVSVMAAAWIAAGPVITRMRRLASKVREAADAHYERPIDLGGSPKDEIAGLAGAFNDAAATVRRHVVEVESRTEALRQFVADTTHDVALPITVLQHRLVELERTLPRDAAERAQVRASMQEVHYLASLVRNLGAAAKLDAGGAALERTRVDLAALVERVVERHRALARARDVELDYAVPEGAVAADADVTLLEQAVSNLADNAVQYNRPGGKVAIVLDREGASGFVLKVADNGPGVPPEELGRLATRRFRGAEARSRRPDGLGLGLAIVAEAADRLGFALQFSVPPGGGLAAEIRGRTAG